MFNTNLFLIIIGIAMISTGIYISYNKCPPPVVKYRFIPRTLKEEMQSPVKLSELFNDIFNKPSVFLGGEVGFIDSKE